MRLPEPYATRISAVRAAMTQKKLDAYLIQDRLNQIWLTGFTGEDGGVLLTHSRVILLTDGRFDETADIEAPFAKKVIRKTRGPESYAKAIKAARAGKVGYEPAHMTVQMFTELRKALPRVRFAAASGLVSELRQIKDADELRRIRRAIGIAEQVFANMMGWLSPGMREQEVAARVEFEMKSLGAQGAAFPTNVSAGPNASLPHHDSGDREIRRGEMMLIDWGARREWYVSDLTRVVAIGSISPELSEVERIVAQAHDAAIAVVKAGVKAKTVDAAARTIIHKSGYGKNFTHSTGHAIGLAVHETPGLRKQGADVLKAGMVVTIEPGIYLPGIGGVRLEDDVLVTDNGCEVLSSLPLHWAI